jgi:hypothetical protein
MSVIRSGTTLHELAVQARTLAEPGEPLSVRDCESLQRQLQDWLRSDALPELATTFISPQIDGLRKRIAKLPTASSGLTEGEIKALAKGLVNYLRNGFAPEMMERLIKPELAAIDTRLAALEAKRSVTYEGIFDPAKSYSPGMLCTHHGSIWHCERACTGVSPDTEAGSETWVLAVKKGRDGRDRK